MALNYSLVFLGLFAAAFLLQGCHQAQDADLTFEDSQPTEPSVIGDAQHKREDDAWHLKRIKRFFGGWFASTADPGDSPTTTASPSPKNNEGRTTRQLHHQEQVPDYNFGDEDEDEDDDDNEIHGSGDGETQKFPDFPGGDPRPVLTLPPLDHAPTTPATHGAPAQRIFRSTVTVLNRPYEPALAIPQTEQFRQLSTEFEDSLDEHLTLDLAMSGYQGAPVKVTVLRFGQTVANRAPALSVQFDVRVDPSGDGEVIRRTIRSLLSRGGVDTYQLAQEGFAFEELGAPTTLQCGPNQFKCDEGKRCVDESRRCDRRHDCIDRTDEAHCPSPPPPASVQCGRDQFLCDGGRRCVDNFRRCDNHRDCLDNSDERGCQSQCGPREFECDGGRTCVEERRRCDLIRDCSDGSDEENCRTPSDTHPRVPTHERCSPGEFRCSSGECLDGTRRCDRTRDCPGGEDEEGCLECPPHEFRCERHGCIPMSKRCDGVQDCPDGSGLDERGCPEPSDDCIPHKEFRCSNGECIARGLLCNGRKECTDGSDERNCPCRANQFQCKNGFCINIYRRCDSYNDCEDHSDEDGCPGKCSPTDFRCRDGSCLPASSRCNGTEECADGFDELHCLPPCRHDQFRCRSGSCLDNARRCDRISDCPGGEDELSCTEYCRSNEFRCTSGQCVDQSRKCDRRRDCDDGSDEENCVFPDKCSAHEFQCSDGTCVPIYLRCNGRVECRDSSDEKDCRKLCASTMFRCADGDCIPSKHHCDGKYDCDDASDEDECECKSDEFKCTSGMCIDARRKCDDRVDCDDFSDEAHCAKECKSHEFKCRSGMCIDARRRCDGRTDCEDFSDEAGCVTECKDHEFRCGDGKCIDSRRKCDGRADCGDFSDEADCQCKDHEFRCGGGKCIDMHKRCDGTADCRDYSDERDCDCKESDFRCGDGTCIDLSKRCDKTADCKDNSDEHNCSVSQACRADEFRCKSGECIQHTLRCNRRRECPDGSDEDNCCTSDEFHCRSGECIAKHFRCNNQYECRDGSDESECRVCQPGQYVCANSQCIERSQRCDGKYDCRDFSDEAGCDADAGMNIRVYPERQTIRQSQEVVFRCRDEGMRRSQVRWSRADDAPLPPGSTDARGRLTMPNIQPEHGGVYLCKAVGAPSGATGAQKAAFLIVQPYTPPTHKPTRPTEACKHEEATCQNGQCIPRKYVCDGDYDCEDGSDENNCVPQSHCEPNEMQCDSKKCILKVYHCDGDDDCGDGTDERGCRESIPGSPCRAGEYQCLSGDQCIPKSFQCDGEFDCQDKSDEIGCSAPTITIPPPEVVTVIEGETVNISCTAIGHPVPLINWRLNWGHIPPPPRVTTSSEGGHGVVTIRDAKPSDQGAWSCEAINSKQSVIATPDAIVVVKSRGVCHPPMFNDKAKSTSDCLRCFCFGVSQNCHSSSLYKTTIPLVTGVSLATFTPQPDGSYMDVTHKFPPNQNAVHFDSANRRFRIDSQVKTSDAPVSYYWNLPAEFRGNQLNSYGGHLKYTFRYKASARPSAVADVIISGNGLTLTHTLRQSYGPQRDNTVQVQFAEGEWLKTPSADHHGRHRGSKDIATREDIMQVLQNVENIFVRASFDDSLTESSIENIEIESASYIDPKNEPAVHVEQCSCPEGYIGNSCEHCAPGYVRRRSGPYLGECLQGVLPCSCNGHSNSCDQQTGQCQNCQHNTDGPHCEVCKRGYYGDARRGTPSDCQPCPCPFVTVPNQFAPTCEVDAHGDVTCTSCPIGYEGRLCETCAPGYERYPPSPDGVCRQKECEQGQFQCGDGSCIEARRRCDGRYDCNDYSDEQKCGSTQCDPAGSLSPEPNPLTGLCQCKPMVTGAACDQCKANSFYLHPSAPYGCVECFCMGITKSCSSSYYHREQEVLKFTSSTEGVHLTSLDRTVTIDRGLKLDPRSKELVYQDFSSHPQQTYYWSLPPRFLGDKGTSYGGFFNLTLRSDGSGTPNVDPFAQIRGNKIILMYRHPEQLRYRFPQHISIPMYETSWVRDDGLPATREHFLMALADLSAIYIRATFGSDTDAASLVEASLDIAVPYPTGQPMAHAVEHCRCPVGYKGLSCEDCDAGYTRSGAGLYLGLCVPCFCNGHSSDCDPETGVCRNCQHNTHGEYCEQCLPGFHGKATDGNPSDCEISQDSTCKCDPRGSTRPDCDARGTCSCKANVQGSNCNRCKDGHFNLELSNPEGCSPCFCFDVTKVCSSSSYYRNETAMHLRGLSDPYSHNFQLSNRYHSSVVTEAIIVNPSSNEVSYSSFPRDPVAKETLFWSLPAQFLGNKLSSYGGVLRYTQHFTADGEGETYSDADVQISGNGVTLFHVNIPPLPPSETRTFEITLREAYWQKVDSRGPTASTREDLMKALANIEVLLVRASFNSHMRSTSLRNVSLSTAVPHRQGGHAVAVEVEQCTCPPGYNGLSCEECAPGYIRDTSGPGLGRCTRCRCNGHSESCDAATGNCVRCRHNTVGDFCQKCADGFYGDATRGTPEDCRPCPCPHTVPSNQFSRTCFLDTDSNPTCNACLPGYTGRNCERCAPGYKGTPSQLGGRCDSSSDVGPSMSVRVEEPREQRVRVGTTVTLRCTGTSQFNAPFSLVWTKEPSVGAAPGAAAPRATPRLTEASGILTIFNVQLEDAGTYVCTGSDTTSTVQEAAILRVDDVDQNAAPRIRIEPHYQEVKVHHPVEFRCIGEGFPPPKLIWTGGRGGVLNPESTFIGGVFRIPSARKDDEAEYFCTGTNSLGTDRVRTVLFVRGEDTNVGEGPHVNIHPKSHDVRKGETVHLDCRATGHPAPNLTWSFQSADSERLPANANQVGGRLTLLEVDENNEGNYFCTAKNRYGTTHGHTSLRVMTRGSIPSIHMVPERQTVKQGEDAEIRCKTLGTHNPVIFFSKVGEPNLSQRHIVQGDTLIIQQTEVEDRGRYVCEVQYDGKTARSVSELEVERREPPAVEIYPPNLAPIQDGAGALLQCRVTAGIPTPTVEWTRADGSPFTPSTELINPGILRINRFTRDEAGEYRCTAKNEMGEVTASATLRVHGSPRVRILQQNPYNVRVGDQIRLDCVTQGDPKPKAFWSRLRQPITTYSSVEDVQDGTTTLFIRRVAPSDAGVYICNVSSAEGTAQERIQVVVQSDNTGVPGGVVEPQTATAKVGEPATLRCRVEEMDQPVQYKWVKVHDGNMSEHTVDNGMLIFRSIRPSDAGEYACQVEENGVKVFERHMRLVVVAPPTIQLNPTRQHVRSGHHVYIQCTATGDQPITFHWTREGEELPGSVVQRDGILEFRGIAASDAGRYICTAVNAAGQAAGTAEVIVADGHPAGNLKKEETAFVGSNVELKCPLPGVHPSTIEWTKDSRPLPQNARVSNGELWIRDVRRENAGRYICLSKPPGTQPVRDYVILHVKDVPSFEVKIQPSKEYVHMGDTLDLHCRITSDAATSVKWTKLSKDTQFPDNVRVRGPVLSINGVRPENGGVYRCSVDSPGGALNDDYVLAIEETPTVPPNEVETRTAPYGSTVILDCVTKVKLDDPVAYTWSKQSGILPHKAESHHATLKIPDLKSTDAGTYVCTVKSEHSTFEVPTILVVTGLLPRFTQAPLSYMKLPTIPNAYMSFEIEIKFKPEKDNGLLLYNGQQEDGGGDFISMGLTDGYVVFRFELGSGLGYIRSEQPVQVDAWHTAKVTREKKVATLKVDDQSEVTGSSGGRMMGLDLTQNLFVGSVPSFDKISKASGYAEGFVGCVSNIKFGPVNVDFGREAEMVGTTLCETCAVNPCLHDGVCQEAPTEGGYRCICPPGFSGQDCEIVGEACYPGVCGEGRCVNRAGGGFDCYCPFGRTGLRCEKDISIIEPALSDDAYLAYPTPSGAQSSLKFDMKFKPNKLDDCLLMYCAQYPDKSGDFTSIGIKDGHLEFRYDAGTGMAVITHPEKLQADDWVTVSASRSAQEGSLVLNDGYKVTGRSPGAAMGVNLNIPMYVGGVDKDKIKVHPGAGVSKGFDGCISSIEVNNHNVDLIQAVVDASNVADCGGTTPCAKSPCQNNAMCIERGPGPNDYDCVCKRGYTGLRCELEDDFCSKTNPCQNGAACINDGTTYRCNCPKGFRGPTCEFRTLFDESVKFNGDGWVTLSRDLLPHAASNSPEVIKLSFSTTERNGLLLFQGQPVGVSAKGQDYLSLAVVNGHLEFSYEMGGGPAQITSDHRVDDGELHTVELKRTGKRGSLRLDTHPEKEGDSGGLLIMLNTKSDIYIGGAPDPQEMTAGRHAQGFRGCIFNVQIRKPDVLNLYTESLESANAEQCDEHPGSGDFSVFNAISNK
ncbi:basement membrane-specific heparan sulfate proteoglycan core protein-like isoform X3 [Ornithodoros turicata]|uniref:basement membrane-specific heparan sulfate proteoglycan core protein-like isoform X3 n=1 Tax=Ornithodoros turicata TaxID=34597 RepID=UPI003138E542